MHHHAKISHHIITRIIQHPHLTSFNTLMISVAQNLNHGSLQFLKTNLQS